MVTLSTQCGGSLGVTFLEVRSLRGVDFVLFNTHLCFTNPAQHAIQVIDTLADRYPGRCAVVLGDLNSRQGGDTMNFLLEQGSSWVASVLCRSMTPERSPGVTARPVWARASTGS